MWGLEIQMIKILHSDISHGTVCDSEKPKPDLEQLHQLVHKIPSILHLKPTFSILHHFYKTPTSVSLFYKIFQ